jgi:hypothetical protein
MSTLHRPVATHDETEERPRCGYKLPRPGARSPLIVTLNTPGLQARDALDNESEEGCPNSINGSECCPARVPHAQDSDDTYECECGRSQQCRIILEFAAPAST